MKMLGLLWDAKSDDLQYKVTIEKFAKNTKRLVLSKIAQIFDPLGLLGLVVIVAKCIMQSMWKLKTRWDEALPPELQAKWNEYYSLLQQINDVRIQRNINPNNEDCKFDLFGFGDASERAYGACLYAVSQSAKETTESHLICSKSRVAPLKTISLPRHELNAALFLAKLCDTTRNAYGNKIRNVHLWSNFTVVLSWIAKSPKVRKTYMANRISKIQNLSHDVTWRHVPSKENPADLLSRGIIVETWRNDQLWWHGPQWLVTGQWPQTPAIGIDTSEMKTITLLTQKRLNYDILQRFSEYEKLQRVIAYWLRFKANALGAKKRGFLQLEELEHADTNIAKMVQCEIFLSELQVLEKGQQVLKGSRLTPLSPFLDKEGVIRVGRAVVKSRGVRDSKTPDSITS
ncbi:uncharacterized protein [Linepithema humile]|uniref:uncharacterized protein n=1 Tax=Linepithema humile TaxID=83485 RepID=UPI00351DCA94